MAMIGKIRRMHLRQGKSVREIVRLTSLSRNTVRKWLKAPLEGGARQGSCRVIYAASGCLSSAFEWPWTTESRSGLRVTAPMGDQSRVAPDQRAGLRWRAGRYSACLAARMA